jgi:hypothetical protein
MYVDFLYYNVVSSTSSCRLVLLLYSHPNGMEYCTGNRGMIDRLIRLNRRFCQDVDVDTIISDMRVCSRFAIIVASRR